MTGADTRYWALGMAVGWMLAVGVGTSLASRHRRIGLALCLAGLTGAIAWREPLARHVERIYLIEHAGTMAIVALGFGTTLRGNGPDLITWLATRVHGPLPPQVKLYTRQVTVAWTVLLAGIGLMSIMLYLTAPLAWWSTFAYLLTAPLIAAMFIIEYAIRLRRFPDFPHVSIFEGFRAWRGNASDSRRP